MHFALPDSLKQSSPSGLGVVFADGALWIANSVAVTRITPWPGLTAWTRRHSAARWRRHRPAADFRALWPLKAAAQGGAPLPDGLAAWSGLMDSIPKAVGDRIAPLPSGHWRVARLVAREPRMLDLFDNPALAFALAFVDRFANRHDLVALGGGGESAAATLATRKRRVIAGVLGFPATEASVRLLGRVPVEAVSVSLVRAIRRILLTDPSTARTLPHVPVITAPLLGLVRNPRVLGVCSRALLHRLAEWEPEVAEAFVTLLEDTVGMADVLRSSGHVSALVFPADGVRDKEQLESLHEVLVDAMDELEKTVVAAPLPPPPFDGTASIVPLRTATDLLLEGREQRNCVGGYVDRVRARRAYVYRVLKPERATLSIVPDAGGWRISELKRRLNRPVSPETHASVAAWLGTRLHACDADFPVFAERTVGARALAALYRLRMRSLTPRPGDPRTGRMVFAILEPERATLEVERDGRGLRVKRLEAAEGGAVQPHTRAAVERWLVRSRAAESADRFGLVERRSRRLRGFGPRGRA